MALAPGLSVHHWDSPERLVPSSSSVESGPFTELNLAPSPAAAVAGMILRRRAGSQQSIWEVVKDAEGAAIYALEAPGVRVKDGHSDSRLVGGTRGLRKEGERAQGQLVHAVEGRQPVARGAAMRTGEGIPFDYASSGEWVAMKTHFEEAVAAVEIPNDSSRSVAQLDWSFVAPIPRLEALLREGSLRLVYLGQSGVHWRDMLRMTDVAGRPAGARFAYYLARETARDLLSIRRQNGLQDWLRFATAILAFFGGLGSLAWLLSQATSLLR
jgi:hypothetical protein